MNIDVSKISIEELIGLDGFDCGCGKHHSALTRRAVVCDGAVAQLPELLHECGAKRPFLLSGAASFAAAGEAVEQVLGVAGIRFSKYVFPESPVAPTERTVGSALMHFDRGCDCIAAVGSGVINDTAKLLAAVSGRPLIVVATAPSMDGYTSATSSMEMDGLKVSLPSAGAWAVIGDLDILANAPMRMLQAGVGDMVAKYVSLCEWRLANIIVGEYYCPTVAALVNTALERVAAAAPGLVRRDHGAVKAVMDGMLLAGSAMQYAGLSRPASGMEHYFSHIWDMRALAFEDARADLHGIQCGIGTLCSLKAYEYIRAARPERKTAMDYVRRFSADAWFGELRAFIGAGAEAMIAQERTDPKYDAASHARRIELIIDHWDELMAVVDTMPSYDSVYALLKSIGAPVSPAELGYEGEALRNTFKMTKDIRNKYIGSRLLWDVGLLDDAAQTLF